MLTTDWKTFPNALKQLWCDACSCGRHWFKSHHHHHQITTITCSQLKGLVTLSICLSVYLSIYLSTYLLLFYHFVCLCYSVYHFVYLSSYMPAYRSVCCFVRLSIILSQHDDKDTHVRRLSLSAFPGAHPVKPLWPCSLTVPFPRNQAYLFKCRAGECRARADPLYFQSALARPLTSLERTAVSPRMVRCLSHQHLLDFHVNQRDCITILNYVCVK